MSTEITFQLQFHCGMTHLHLFLCNQITLSTLTVELDTWLLTEAGDFGLLKILYTEYNMQMP